MATWEYGELMLESIGLSEDGDWRSKVAITWHDPTESTTALKGTAVSNLNALGAVGWELVSATRNHLEERFQIKVVTTYTLKRRLS